ncbi:MAG: site-specific integrase [Planctomycetes bacterium]|nr:site-specific integrase [Planctomycetota bacterium]
MARLSDEQKAELKQWRDDHSWHPHQLRHLAATRLAKEFGGETSRIVLGHTSGAITESYIDRNQTIADAFKPFVGIDIADVSTIFEYDGTTESQYSITSGEIRDVNENGCAVGSVTLSDGSTRRFSSFHLIVLGQSVLIRPSGSSCLKSLEGLKRPSRT